MSKYRNRKVERDGLTFDSVKEANRYAQLMLLQRAGQIKDLRRQTRWPIRVNGALICHYVSDFDYLDAKTGKAVVEDVKSSFTAKLPVFRLKAKLMAAVNRVQVVLT